MLRGCLVVAIVCAITQAQGTSKEKVYNTKIAIKPKGSANFLCKAEARTDLTSCAFRLRYQYDNLSKAEDGPVIQLNGRTTTTVNASNSGKKLYAAGYRGSGLANGDCGIALSKVAEGRYLIGCRVGFSDGGWIQNYMSLFVGYKIDQFASKLTDDEVIKVVPFNENLAIELKLVHENYFTGVCQLDGHQNVSVRDGEKPSLDSRNQVCSIPIRATDEANGPIWATAPYNYKGKKRYSSTWRFMKLIAVEKPAPVLLDLSLPEASRYIEGNEMNATCTAVGYIHNATISWMLGDEELGENVTFNFPEKWTWPWEARTIVATIARNLSLKDVGNNLTCYVQYFDSNKNVTIIKQNSSMLSVQEMTTTTTTTTTTPTPTSSLPTNETPENGIETAGDNGKGRSADNDLSLISALIVAVLLVLAVGAGIVYVKIAKKCCLQDTVPTAAWPRPLPRPHAIEKAVTRAGQLGALLGEDSDGYILPLTRR